MHGISALEGIRKVAVIDDSRDSRESIAEQIYELSFEPVPFDGSFDSLDDFMSWITSGGIDAAVCDQILSTGGLARFYGAEAVAKCYRNFMPAVLLTQFFNNQLRLIRPWMRYIPMIVKDDDDFDIIRKGFDLCKAEHHNIFSEYRQPWRALMRIIDLESISGEMYATVIIPGWDPNTKVELPLAMIPNEIREMIKPGFRLYADINKGAEKQEEIFFENFRLE